MPSGMRAYRVTFSLHGKRYADEITASNSFDARRLIQDRYPDAFIMDVCAL